MIKLERKASQGITLRDPVNLIPMIFKCRDCGCTIRKLEETQSYILMAVHREIELGNRKICPFCYRLKEFKGVG